MVSTTERIISNKEYNASLKYYNQLVQIQFSRVVYK